MIKPQCEFTGNRCVKDTCENCGVYEINHPTVTEEVYDKCYDTAGNYHWKGTQTGEHMINYSETIKEDWDGR